MSTKEISYAEISKGLKTFIAQKMKSSYSMRVQRQEVLKGELSPERYKVDVEFSYALDSFIFEVSYNSLKALDSTKSRTTTDTKNYQTEIIIGKHPRRIRDHIKLALNRFLPNRWNLEVDYINITTQELKTVYTTNNITEHYNVCPHINTEPNHRDHVNFLMTGEQSPSKRY